jgi:hypothetical protein
MSHLYWEVVVKVLLLLPLLLFRSHVVDLSYTGQDIVNLLIEDIDVEGVDANVKAKRKTKEASMFTH